MLARPITEMSARNLVVINAECREALGFSSTDICDEAGNVIETHEHAGDFKEL